MFGRPYRVFAACLWWSTGGIGSFADLIRLHGYWGVHVARGVLHQLRCVDAGPGGADVNDIRP